MGPAQATQGVKSKGQSLQSLSASVTSGHKVCDLCPPPPRSFISSLIKEPLWVGHEPEPRKYSARAAPTLGGLAAEMRPGQYGMGTGYWSVSDVSTNPAISSVFTSSVEWPL